MRWLENLRTAAIPAALLFIIDAAYQGLVSHGLQLNAEAATQNTVPLAQFCPRPADLLRGCLLLLAPFTTPRPRSSQQHDDALFQGDPRGRLHPTTPSQQQGLLRNHAVCAR